MFSEIYESYRTLTDAELEKWLPEVDERSGILGEAMRYSLEAGGKRLRPVLLLAVCEIAGGKAGDALPFACAMEFIHTYSLIHDDHPSMDDDDLRRGKPTNHKVYGDDMAILAGDGLLNSAFEIMIGEIVKADAVNDSERRERCIRAAAEIAEAAGARGMVAGQAADCRPELVNGSGEERLLYIHRNKTGAIIRASVRAGAILGGAGEAELDVFTRYAENIGLTFQIVDDILDVIGSIRELGKKTGSDAEQGKLTYPSVYGLEYSYDRAREVTELAVRALEELSEPARQTVDRTDSENAGTEFLRELAYDLLKRIA